MKKILVPTDFSEVSEFAIEAAIKLAPKLNAEIHFYTRVHLHPDWDELTETEKTEYPESQQNLDLAKTQFMALRKKYADHKVKMVMSYSSGDFIDVVANYIDEEKIYMIIMGSSGADGWKELLFGSNAQKIVRNAHCPVLVIKHPVEEWQFNHIVFASDFRPSAKAAFEKVIDFGWHFGSHIHLLYVEPDEKLKEPDAKMKGRVEEFEKMCWKLPCTIHEHSDINVELGITHFAQDTRVDLISVTHYGEEDIFKRLFKGTITEKLVNHSEMPVLVINSHQRKVWQMFDPEKKTKITL